MYLDSDKSCRLRLFFWLEDNDHRVRLPVNCGAVIEESVAKRNMIRGCADGHKINDLLSGLRDQLKEEVGRSKNRLHRELTIVFPEYKAAFGKLDGPFTLSLLSKAPIPSDLVALGEAGIRKIWHDRKLRGAGYRRVAEIIRQASNSVGLTDGVDAHKICILHYVADIERLTSEIAEIEAELAAKCREIPNAENILAICLGETITAGILAEMGDVDRFDDAKEIQKLSGLGLVACSSGKHKGQTKISHRGRKRLRYWLYQGAMSLVAHNEASGSSMCITRLGRKTR